MQSLNDDMDELFRRAAEQYPLNTDGADWNKVMQKLPHSNEELPETGKNKKDFRYLLLLLLLPIGFICGRYLGNNHKDATTPGNKEVSIASEPPVVQNKPIVAGQNKGKTNTIASESQSRPE